MENQNKQPWHQQLLGVIVLTVGLNLLSTYLYDSTLYKFVNKTKHKKVPSK